MALACHAGATLSRCATTVGSWSVAPCWHYLPLPRKSEPFIQCNTKRVDWFKNPRSHRSNSDGDSDPPSFRHHGQVLVGRMYERDQDTYPGDASFPWNGQVPTYSPKAESKLGASGPATAVFPLSQTNPWLCYSIRAELVKFADGEYKED